MGSFDLWDRFASLADVWWARHGVVPPDDIAAHRLQALVAFARGHSPFYARHYRDLPGGAVPLSQLPPVRKPQLMAAFDEWVTDPAIRRAEVERFVHSQPVGERFLGRYVVFQSSGTTGTPALFVQDGHALAVYDALVAAQMGEPWLAGAALAALSGPGALIAATHGHFASIASWEQSCRVYGRAPHALSVLEPAARWVGALNHLSPAFVASYPSVLAMLAGERVAGSLQAAPALLWAGGETLAPAVRAFVESAFAAPLVSEYGASECLGIAASCSAGNLHVHADWVIVEPVDARYRAVKRGETSHTVLVTNLANWTQPIIRYDLGDRVTVLPQACACGKPSPALRVQGRKDDVLLMRSLRGERIRLAPMAVASVIEDGAGLHRFQVVQTAPDALSLRLPLGVDARVAAWRRARPALAAWLESQGLGNVRLALDRQGPRADRASGKLRTVVGLR